jgi:hypothetical protein
LLRECQECARLSRQRVTTLKSLKYKIYFWFNTFVNTTWFHVLFQSFNVLTIMGRQGSLVVSVGLVTERLQVQIPELTRYKSVVLPLNRQLTYCS